MEAVSGRFVFFFVANISSKDLKVSLGLASTTVRSYGQASIAKILGASRCVAVHLADGHIRTLRRFLMPGFMTLLAEVRDVFGSSRRRKR